MDVEAQPGAPARPGTKQPFRNHEILRLGKLEIALLAHDPTDGQAGRGGDRSIVGVGGVRRFTVCREDAAEPKSLRLWARPRLLRSHRGPRHRPKVVSACRPRARWQHGRKALQSVEHPVDHRRGHQRSRRVVDQRSRRRCGRERGSPVRRAQLPVEWLRPSPARAEQGQRSPLCTGRDPPRR